jgi:RNA polymerase sigma factor (sigma-70 family)
VADNLGLVDRIAKRVKKNLPPCFDLEDLRQAGSVGLLDAANKFRADFGVPFHQFAKRRVQGEIVESVRRRRWRDSTHAPLTPRVLEMGAGRAPETLTAEVERREKARLVAEAQAAVSPRARKVIEIYFRRDGKLAGIAAEFGVKQSRASQLLHIAQREMKRELSYRGLKAA